MRASPHRTGHTHHDHHAPLPTSGRALVIELVSDEESARHSARVELVPTTNGAGA